ncbi:translation initiation factor eIF3 subunit [Actinidia rufa]|uniref:Translation initiation factor eIF3 subunit n=1 Tax=Actinidia rufa TaxID=165716 RepID=A0A7J0GFR7_9ERIC|nr:translation initiation factor eIF3 subunit [Actinidia rufa]
MILKINAIFTEDEPISPVLKKEQPKNKWDDEDIDDDDVKESWEDEEETAPAPAPAPPAEKVPKKMSAKASEKKGKTVEVAKEVPLDPLAEKLRQERKRNNAVKFKNTFLYHSMTGYCPESPPWLTIRVSNPLADTKQPISGHRVHYPEASTPIENLYSSNCTATEPSTGPRLVEEADFKSTRELFGGDVTRRPLIILFPNLKVISQNMRNSFLINFVHMSFHYIGLLKAVMRLSMTSLKGADAKEVASSVTAIANEKIKAEKEANAGKKKTGAKKKQLHVDKPDDDAVVAYDAYDDYDFM